MKKLLYVASISLLFIQTSCSSSEHEVEENLNFLVSSPIIMDTTVVKEYVCQIHSISHIELRTQERGYLKKIYVDEGKLVKEGQLLFQIMPNLYQADVKIRQAEVELAEIEYQNTKQLSDKNVVSKNELAMAKARLDKAKAELSLANVHLQFTEIRAPFEGYIDKFRVRLGSLLEEGDLLTNLSDNRQMWVYFNVPEAEYLNYQQGLKSKEMLKVKLMMANNEFFDQTGVVETIEADFNNETGNIAFRATFQNPDKLLRNGETGNIIMTSELKNALIIPQKATFEVLEKKYVYVVGKDNKVHAKEVTIASEIQDLYIIKSGVTAKDKIMIEGIRKVKENDKIQFTYKSPKKVIAGLKVYVE